MTAEEVVNQSQQPVEGVEGSLAGPLRHRLHGVGAVEEGGGPLQAEVEGSLLAGVAGGQQVLGNSLQPKEVLDEGRLTMVGVGVEVGHFQSPEKTE